MGEYAGSSSCFKPCLPSMAMEYGMDLMTSQLEECTMEIPSLELMSYFDEDYLSIYVSSPDGRLLASPVLPVPVASSDAELSRGEGRKRKSMEVHDLTGNGRFSESGLTETKISENKNSSRNGKRARDNSKEADKQTEVVHVRARRGQATDSHSLAERSRRERIKERMRVLQDLVPGCHKSKGMTGMLDEIINYVRSLQNQVEFLSLTASAACSVYEHHCFDVEVTAAPQGGDGLLVSRDDYGGCNSLSSIMPL